MWPMNDSDVKDDERGVASDQREGAEQSPGDAPDETEEPVPEEAGYGYGV